MGERLNILTCFLTSDLDCLSELHKNEKERKMIKKITLTSIVIGISMLGNKVAGSEYEVLGRDGNRYKHTTLNIGGYNIPFITKIEIPMDQNHEPVYPPSTISATTPEMIEHDNNIKRSNAAFRAYLNTSVAEEYDNTETGSMLVPQKLSNAYSAARGYYPYK